ncbi:hypothetical protein [Desulfurococcus amylolyticus]|uniref:Uncharacterized protein n=1 Tax=Desulfurococcus amylolyticus DSM 16532 TaxID=768672 RepID=I3XTE5_DESAM|nr:hypothetical protein [Desulfurococcus amylolyticus]AFL67219.1 hypothetical protein Desfe_1353 [Desulfurococcus amylolyticus DSM 16532]
MSNNILNVSRLLGNTYRIWFLGRDIYVEIGICSKTCDSLDEEIASLNPADNSVLAIIPRSMVSNVSQIIQGAIHLIIYEDRLTRFRNKGLLLMMLSTGYNQISEMLLEARKMFSKDNEYYLVKVYRDSTETQSPSSRSKAGNCRLVEEPKCGEDCLRLLVKNLSVLLGLL